MIGRPELKEEPRFSTPIKRGDHVDEIIRQVENWTSNFTKFEAMEKLGAVGVPCGAVMDTKELSDDSTMRDREIFVEVDHPVRGRVLMPGWPVKMTDSHVKVTASPLLGADSSEVYAEWLDLSTDELTALKSEGVI